jgi:hypothetical protein
MSFSADVSAGDTILATDHNNLRKDVIDTTNGHAHNGTDSKAIFNNVASYLSSDSHTLVGGDTYINASITTNGGKILILGRVYCVGSVANWLLLRGQLERDGVKIDDTYACCFSDDGGGTNAGEASISFMYIDTQVAGTYVYRIRFEVTVGSGSPSKEGSIYAVELPS